MLLMASSRNSLLILDMAGAKQEIEMGSVNVSSLTIIQISANQMMSRENQSKFRLKMVLLAIQ